MRFTISLGHISGSYFWIIVINLPRERKHFVDLLYPYLTGFKKNILI